MLEIGVKKYAGGATSDFTDLTYFFSFPARRLQCWQFSKDMDVMRFAALARRDREIV
jgi:hypothetical protein